MQQQITAIPLVMYCEYHYSLDTYVCNFNRIYGGSICQWNYELIYHSHEQKKNTRRLQWMVLNYVWLPHYTCTFWKYFWLQNFELGLSYNLILLNSFRLLVPSLIILVWISRMGLMYTFFLKCERFHYSKAKVTDNDDTFRGGNSVTKLSESW